MPIFVYRWVLPALLGLLAAVTLVRRHQVGRKLGRDPILVRPWGREDTVHGFLEAVLAVANVLLAADVVLNALWPSWARRSLAVALVRRHAALGWAGLGLVGVGMAIAVPAMFAMADSWRVGIDHENPGPLVRHGLHARIRHSIYLGLLLGSLGIALVTADVLSIAVTTAAWVLIPVQARLEEEFIGKTFPGEYDSYMRRTGRFLPKLGGVEPA